MIGSAGNTTHFGGGSLWSFGLCVGSYNLYLAKPKLFTYWLINKSTWHWCISIRKIKSVCYSTCHAAGS